MTIVCGTDFSEASAPALAAAAAIASRTQAHRLLLVHALDPSLQSVGGPGGQALRDGVAQRLEQEAKRVRAQLGIEVRCELLTGVAGEALVEFAEAQGARMLIVASRGFGNSPLYRVGGTAERAAQAAHLPVLVVRDAAPFDAWARGERALRILLGVDFSETSEPAIRWVRELCRCGRCEVAVGHVYYAEEAQGRYGLTGPCSPVEPDPRAVELLVRDLAGRVGDLGGDGAAKIIPRLALGRAGDHLLEVAAEEKADLIVLGSRHRRGLSRLVSIASVVLRFGEASTACIAAAPGQVLAPEPPLTRRERRVLIATDLSPFSNYVVPLGYDLLGERGGHVHLLHVLPGDSTAERSQIEEALRALIPAFARREGIQTCLEVERSAEPAQAICQTAERIGADVICIASHGRSGLKRVVLGSVAEEVMRRTYRPLFVVRPRTG